MNGYVLMQPARCIVGIERQVAGEQFVEGDPQRVQITALVSRLIEPPALLRGHVCRAAADGLGLGGPGHIVMGGENEAAQAQLVIGAEDEVRRFDIPMGNALGMCRRQR